MLLPKRRGTAADASIKPTALLPTLSGTFLQPPGHQCVDVLVYGHLPAPGLTLALWPDQARVLHSTPTLVPTLQDKAALCCDEAQPSCSMYDLALSQQQMRGTFCQPTRTCTGGALQRSRSKPIAMETDSLQGTPSHTPPTAALGAAQLQPCTCAGKSKCTAAQLHPPLPARGYISLVVCGPLQDYSTSCPPPEASIAAGLTHQPF